MSLVDEVLVNHSDNAGSTFCYWCDGEWPCESVRLALSLRAAEKVVEAAREAKDAYYRPHPGYGCDGCDHEKMGILRIRLAEYDKGGQG